MLYFRLLRESFAFAWSAIVVNKMRTFLSLLGVMVGIFVISAVFTAVDSMEASLKDSFSMISDDVLFIQKWPWGPEGDGEYEWWKYFQRRQPTIRDMEELKGKLSGAEAIAYTVGTMGSVSRGNNSMDEVKVAAVTDAYDRCFSLNIEQGRYFTSGEFKTGKNFVIIGADIAEMLFPEGNAVGGELKVMGLKMTVIGIFAREGSSIISDGFDKMAMINASFGQRLLNMRELDAAVVVKAREGVSNEELKSEVIQQFRAIRKIRPKQDNDFSINQMDMLTSLIDAVFVQVELVGWFIGIFAILVGCFSIANIMFVSVRERTKIIGIQKALGAKNNFILQQFLFEAVALCVFGATMAFGLIVVIAGLINVMDIGITMSINPSRFILAMSIAVFSGLIAGIAPAMQASKMDPVEAMRAK
ncbi:MAG: hypothetical protein RL226_1063 [Bacteroidota bacterium]